MGSFNLQCFVTHQTISEGDACRVMALRQSSTFGMFQVTSDQGEEKILGYANHHSGPDAFWEPETGFLKATYADYGNVTLTLDEHARIRVLTWLKDGLNNLAKAAPQWDTTCSVPTDLYAFMSRELPDLLEGLNSRSVGDLARTDQVDDGIRKAFAYLWEGAVRGSLFVKHHTGARPVAFAIMHEAAYQALFAYYSGFVNLDEFALNALTTTRSKVAKCSVQHPENPAMLDFLFQEFLCSALKAGFSRDALPLTAESRQVRQILDSTRTGFAASEADVHFVKDVKEHVLSDHCVASALSCLSLSYVPLRFGGQDYHNEAGEQYAKLVQKVSAQVSRGRMESMYGTFKSYTAQAPAAFEVAKLSDEAHRWDAAIVDLQVSPAETDEPGAQRVRIRFSSTQDVDDLVEFLAEVEPTGLMAKTVTSA